MDLHQVHGIATPNSKRTLKMGTSKDETPTMFLLLWFLAAELERVNILSYAYLMLFSSVVPSVLLILRK